jgi:thiol-disulfide isomerase/thioredoxin
MKRIPVTIICCLAGLLLSAPVGAQTPACKLDVTIHGFEGKQVYLGYRRADKIYSRDTLDLSDNGRFVFQSDTLIPPGIYLILMPPDNKYFEFVVTHAEQVFSVETTAPDFYQQLRFEGSKDNNLLREYQRYMSDQVSFSKDLQQQQQQEEDADRKIVLEERIDSIAKVVRLWQETFVRDHPGTYTAKLVSAFMEPEIPEPPVLEDGTVDENFRFRYYRQHFWDGFDLSEAAFVNSPYLKEKMDRYLDKLTVQLPDSVIQAVDFILTRAQANQDVFRYSLPYLLNRYYTPTIMGLDAVYVHLAEKYYKSGIADWVTPESLKKISDDAFMIKGVLLGKQAPNVRVQRFDPAQDVFTQDLVSPYDIDAEYTLVFIWKPGCGHCKKLTEELKPFYAEWKDKGVEIFSITSANASELDAAVKDIHEKQMPWIITADPYNRARALQNYYGISLPKLYLLDKDKKIIGNRLGVPQLPEIIRNHRQSADESE